jgi:hypothetical protein
MGAQEELRAWAVQSLRARSIFSQAGHAIEERTEGFDIIIRKPEGIQYCLIQERLDAEAILARAEGRRLLVITANTRENLEELIRQWSRLVPLQGLTVMLANPHAAGDQRWAVAPAIHHLITEPASLRRGLQTLFEGVEEWRP